MTRSCRVYIHFNYVKCIVWWCDREISVHRTHLDFIFQFREVTAKLSFQMNTSKDTLDLIAVMLCNGRTLYTYRFNNELLMMSNFLGSNVGAILI